MSATQAVIQAQGLTKRLRQGRAPPVLALDDISLSVPQGTLAALVGPDGAGKTTLIRLLAGLLPPDDGELFVLGINVARDPQGVQDVVAYMPQRFGLYEDLTVRENLDLYADLHGVTASLREQRYQSLLEMTALGPFLQRLAGQLSGGMKQKLGLACALIQSPQLLLLDEPTAGVDPLSRHELWQIIARLAEQGTSALIATSYLEEAERCQQVVVLRAGKVLAQSAPQNIADRAKNLVVMRDPSPGQTARDLQAGLLDMDEVVDAVPQGGRVRTIFRQPQLNAVAPSFEDGFMTLLAGTPRARVARLPTSPSSQRRDVMVEVRDLFRRFGDFVAVDHLNFNVSRGEVYGLLGPNGAGKSTTFRMLCGLLPATSGTLLIAGKDLRRTPAAARRNIGYLAQRFSLYPQLSVLENLDFFAGIYGLDGRRRRERIRWALEEFELAPMRTQQSGMLPGGLKQRLAMAVALLHEPELLFLDEPTSGADPLARRDFWRRITVLAQGGVTTIITTHFLEEAEYCDRLAILDSGRLLAEGTPAQIRAANAGKAGTTMEDAFLAIVEAARAKAHPS